MLFNLGMCLIGKKRAGLIPRLFGNILNGVVLSNTQKVSVKDRKVVEVGLTRFLAKSDIMISDSHQQLWSVSLAALTSKLTIRAPTFLALLDLFTLPQDITYSGGNGAADDLLELDPEEAGFQSSFSKLGASEKAVHNPVAHIGDAKVYASKEISTRSKGRAGVVSTMIAYKVV